MADTLGEADVGLRADRARQRRTVFRDLAELVSTGQRFRTIYADPPWAFQAWYSGGWRTRPDGSRYYSSPSPRAARYDTMSADDIAAMPVADLAAEDCVLFIWGCWPMLRECLQVIEQGKARLAEGIWVTVFPEGTRVAPGKTKKYGVSGAALARDAGVSIVPVAHNAGDFWPRRGIIKKPGLIRFVIGPPIDASTRDPRETNLLVQEWIEGKMREISSGYAGT